MAGSNWSSADLLTRFNQLAGRPTPPQGSDAVLDSEKYQYLSDAQEFVLTQIESIVPRVLYGPPVQLVTTDEGYTFSFGTDGNGYPLFPSGKAGIFSDLSAIPDAPLIPGVDYLDEGTQIRMPNDTQWNSSPLYWYGITPPQALSDTVQPILQPPSARILIVIEAVRSFAESYARNPSLMDMMDRKWERTFGPQMTAIRLHFRGKRQTQTWRGYQPGFFTTPWGNNVW